MLKRVITSILILFLTLMLTIGAVAVTNLDVISAYINRAVIVEYQGNPQQMYDVLGNEVYPIIYEGTTYLPIRAIAGLFEVNVEWDDDSKIITLGEDTKTADFINNFTPYAGNYSQSKGIILSVDDKTKSIAGTSCDHWLYFNNTEYYYYNLEGKNTSLDFSAYCSDSSRNNRFELYFYGDGELMDSYIIKEYDLPVTQTLDLSGVNQLRICAENPDGSSASSELYLFDMNIS